MHNVSQLQSFIRLHEDLGTLRRDEAILHLKCIQDWISTFHDPQKSSLRQCISNPPGKTCALRAQDLDRVSKCMAGGVSELESFVRKFHEVGLLGDGEASEHLHYLQNRRSELSE